MKTKIFFGILAVLCGMSSCVEVTVPRSAEKEKIVSQKRQLKGFERVTVLGSPDVYYTQADTFGVRVEATKEVLERVKTVVSGGELTVSIDHLHSAGAWLSFNEVKVYVSSPDLIGVAVVGSGDFTASKLVDTDNISLELKGSGNIAFDRLLCDRLQALLVGSGNMKVADAQTITANIELVGSGDIDMLLKQTKTTNVVLKGSGDIDLTFRHGGRVNSRLVGSGDIDLKGDIVQLDKYKNGSGDYDTDELKVKGRRQ